MACPGKADAACRRKQDGRLAKALEQDIPTKRPKCARKPENLQKSLDQAAALGKDRLLATENAGLSLSGESGQRMHLISKTFRG